MFQKSIFSKAMLITVLLNFLFINNYAQNIGDPYIKGFTLVNEGIKLHDDEKYEDALTKYNQVHEGDSAYSLALYEKAITIFKLEKYGEVVDICKQGIALNSGYISNFYLTLADAFDQLKMADSAFHCYDIGAKAFPYSHRFHFEKGITNFGLTNYKEALDCFEKSTKLNLYHPLSHFNVGLIAAKANQKSYAAMSMFFFILLNPNYPSINKFVASLETVLDGEFTTEEKASADLFPFSNDLEEIEQIINSKVALSPKYKLKTKLDFRIFRQMQVLMEKLPAENNFKDQYLYSIYHDFYSELWKSGHFEGACLLAFSGIDIDKVNKEVKSKKSKIDAFLKWANNYLENKRTLKEIMFDGKMQEVSFFYSDRGNLQAIGKLENGERNGLFQFYFEDGNMSSEGRFVKNLKHGDWKYYYNNGVLKKSETFENGILSGKQVTYYPNGCVYEKSTFRNDSLIGPATVFYANGSQKMDLSFKKGKLNGKYIYYYDNGNKNYEYTIDDNSKINGSYTTWHKEGPIKMKAQAKNDLLHGPVEFYSLNGKKSTVGEFLDDNRHGKWTWFYDNGKIQSEGNYEKGKEVGEWKYYYENGNLSDIKFYNNGKLNGLSKSFDENNKILSEIQFKNNKWDELKYFDANGKEIYAAKPSGGKLNYEGYNNLRNKVSEGLLKNLNEEGEWKYYYPNGALKSIEVYSNGRLNGITKNYYKNGQVSIETFYKNGMAEGLSRSYFITGELKSEGYYLNDERHGIWNFYYTNGQKDASEYYYNGDITGVQLSYERNGKMDYKYLYFEGLIQTMIGYDTLSNALFNTSFDCKNETYTLLFENGKPNRKGKLTNGMKEGIYNDFYSSGALYSEVNFIKNMENGIFKSYHENGKLRSTGKMTLNNQDSIWNFFNENGQKDRLITYKEGQMHGLYTSYHYNNKPEYVRQLNYGERHGESFLYSPQGNVAFKMNYYNGVAVSYSYQKNDGSYTAPIFLKGETGNIIAFYKNGQKAIEFGLKNGLLNGDFIFYHENGKVYKKSFYKDGMDEGPQQTFNELGKLIEEENYANDLLHGVTKIFYDNGNIRKETNYQFGIKNGEEKQYDVNGKVIKSINYTNGVIY